MKIFITIDLFDSTLNSVRNVYLGYERDLPAFPTWSIVGNESLGEFNFFIESLKIQDEGIFACEVSPFNNAPSLKHVAHVRTLVEPKFVQILDQYNTRSKDQITIRFDEPQYQIFCRVEQSRPAAHIKWFNETGQEFPATSRVTMKSSINRYFFSEKKMRFSFPSK